MKVATLGPGDDAVDIATNSLGAGLGSLDAVVQKQRGNQVALHSFGMSGIGTNLQTTLLVVPHDTRPPVLLFQAHAHRGKLVLDLFNGLNAEIPNIEQIILAEVKELANRMDTRALQTVEGTHG